VPADATTRARADSPQLSFTREVEVIASTLQPASTVHTFTFELPAATNPYGASPSGDLLRNSVFTGGAGPAFSAPATPMLGPGAGGPHSFLHADPYARPSSMVLGGAHGGGPPLARSTSVGGAGGAASAPASGDVTYHGVCLTVWSHADAERTAAIRRALDGGRMRKESAHSLRAARLRTLRTQAGASSTPRASSRRRRRAYSDVETEPDGETDAGGITESEYDGASTVGHAPGESTVFLPGDAVFWLPYALSKLPTQVGKPTS
jgi:nicotinamide N-methyltransferase